MRVHSRREDEAISTGIIEISFAFLDNIRFYYIVRPHELRVTIPYMSSWSKDLSERRIRGEEIKQQPSPPKMLSSGKPERNPDLSGLHSAFIYT